MITGRAGSGTSALAVHVAHLLADRFPGGQLYVDLRGAGQFGPALTPQAALGQLLDGLGVPAGRVPAGLDAQVGLYRSLLAGRRVLVVLDNARNAEQVRPLLPGASGCRVLVPSRDQLSSLVAMEGAWFVALDPLSPGEPRESPVLGQGAALGSLRESVLASRPRCRNGRRRARARR